MDDFRYNSGARAFHWAIALLVITNLATGLLHEPFENAMNMMPFHKALGLAILVLSLARLGWRLMWTRPPYPSSMSPFERTAASATHAIFYLMMIAMPLTGWIFTSAGKYPLSFFGLFDWPKLGVTKADPIVGAAREFHEIGGYVFLALVVLHIAAALRHHLVLRDGVLRRMA